MFEKRAITILEDDLIFNDGIQKMINSTPDLYCEASYANVLDFKKYFKRNKSSVFWLDISLPDGLGTEVVKFILKERPDALCLICSLHDDDKNIFEAMKAGANGYLLKNTPVDKMLESIYELVNGGSPMSPYIARKVISSFRENEDKKNTAMSILTAREQMVLQHIAKGFLYKEVADTMEISIETVKKHLRSIYSKLQVQNRTEAVIKFLGQS